MSSISIDLFVSELSTAATELESKRNQQLQKLATEFRRGKLRDKESTLSALAAISRTPEQLRAEVMRQDEADKQRAILAGEPALLKRQAACDKKRVEINAALERARAEHATAIAALELESAELHRALSIVGAARAKLVELLSPEEIGNLDEIDARIADLSRQRADLQGVLHDGDAYYSTAGSRMATHYSRVAVLRGRIRQAKDEHHKSPNPDRRAHLLETVADAERAIGEIEKQAAADRKRLAAVEADLAKATADRAKAVSQLMKG
jgi:hypothetical protein